MTIDEVMALVPMGTSVTMVNTDSGSLLIRLSKAHDERSDKILTVAREITRGARGSLAFRLELTRAVGELRAAQDSAWLENAKQGANA